MEGRMLRYLLRRVIYAVFILLGVNLITFVLFFAVNTPDDMARLSIGGQRVSQEAIEQWKREHGYDKPLFYNAAERGLQKAQKTIFYERSVPLLRFDFGFSDDGHDISQQIKEHIGRSLALAMTNILLGGWMSMSLSLLLTLFRFS